MSTGGPRRNRYIVYAAGLFGLSIVPMSTVAVPLWALDIGAAPLLIGLALGARAALSIPFSIHGGALMDRLGTRRIMIASGVAVAVLAPLYTVLPWIEALIALQLASGFFQGMAWMGAQTRISLMSRGDPTVVGRFAFVSTLGNFVGPLATGIAWDWIGPAGAFALIALCGVGIAVSAALLPADGVEDGNDGPAPPPIAARDLMPRLGDYTEAFRLTMMPAVGFVVASSFLMTSIYGVRHSFYTVYLDHIGLSGTLIGVLFASGSLSASVFALAVGRVRRHLPDNWVLIGAVTIATLGIGATPLLDSFGPLLAVSLVWGIGGGLAFPMTLFLLARNVSPEQQGMTIGIRTTVNRTAGFATPVAMGAIAGAIGIGVSFFVVGAIVLACLSGLALWLARSPSLRTRD